MCPVAFQGKELTVPALGWQCHGIFHRWLGGKSHPHQTDSMFQCGDSNPLGVAHPLWVGAVSRGKTGLISLTLRGPTFSFYTELCKSYSWLHLTWLPKTALYLIELYGAWGGLLKFSVLVCPLFWNRVKALSVSLRFCSIVKFHNMHISYISCVMWGKWLNISGP